MEPAAVQRLRGYPTGRPEIRLVPVGVSGPELMLLGLIAPQTHGREGSSSHLPK